MDTAIDRARHLGAQAVFILTLCGTGRASALAQNFSPPPVVEPVSREHHPGKMIWAELVTPDLALSKQFYGGLFGWTFRDLGGVAAGDLAALFSVQSRRLPGGMGGTDM